jgi:DNA-binding response OmpR family regulator
VHVGNLRRKLREAGHDQLIQTIRGVGFCLKVPDGAGG